MQKITKILTSPLFGLLVGSFICIAACFVLFLNDIVSPGTEFHCGIFYGLGMSLISESVASKFAPIKK